MKPKLKIRFKFKSNNQNITKFSDHFNLYSADGRYPSFNGGDNIFENLEQGVDVIQMGSEYFRFMGMASTVLTKEALAECPDDNGVYRKINPVNFELEEAEYEIDFDNEVQPLKVHRHNTEDLEDYTFDPQYALLDFEDLKMEIVEELAEFEGIDDPKFKPEDHFDELRINQRGSKVWITSTEWGQHHQYMIDNFSDLSKETRKAFNQQFTSIAEQSEENVL